jgi:hypothetical protein
VVECDLAKVEVAGSNPVSRSRFSLCTRNSSTIEDTKLGKALNLQAFSRTWACAENQVT